MCRTSSLLLALGLVLATAGCQKEEHHEKPAEPAPSADKTPTMDPELAKAMAAASAEAKTQAQQGGPGEPPPGGIFPPGAADAQIKKGAPATLTLGGAGAEPRVSLAPSQPKPGWKTQGTFDIEVGSDPRQAPLPITFAVTLEAQKAKAAPAGTGPAPVHMQAKVTDARPGITGVPEDELARLAKLKGATIEYEILPNGAGTGYHWDAPQGADEVKNQLRHLTDALALVTLPMPSQPVGKGAYWMVTSREGVLGLDLVTYRLVKVEDVEGDTVTLSLGTKRYETSNHFDFEGLPPDAPHELADFECKSDGKVVFKAGTPFAQSGEIDSALMAGLVMPGKVKQRGQLQIQTHVALDFAKH